MNTSTTTDAASANLRIWNRLQRLPFGNKIFSQAVCFKAPYFRSVHPTITVLRPGRCEVHAPNRRSSHNHLGTYHAIASCNLAELAAGVMTDVTIPATHRWIPVAMSVEYLAKASTDMMATATLDPLPEIGEEPSTITVPVEITTTDGSVAVKAHITMRVSPKRRQRVDG
jgi:acyl-coenzyme A thioesterase PaaI-like protein